MQAQAEGKIRSDIECNVAKRCSMIAKIAEGTPKTLTKALERVKAQIRARVKHPFHVVKNLFHHKECGQRPRRGASVHQYRAYQSQKFGNSIVFRKTN